MPQKAQAANRRALTLFPSSAHHLVRPGEDGPVGRARRFYSRMVVPTGAKSRLFDDVRQRREDKEFRDEFVRLAMERLDQLQPE